MESVRAKSDLHGFGDSRIAQTEVGSGARQVENTVKGLAAQLHLAHGCAQEQPLRIVDAPKVLGLCDLGYFACSCPQASHKTCRYSEESTSGFKMTWHGNRHLSSTVSQEVHFMSRSDVAGPYRSASSRSSVRRLLDLSRALSTTRRPLTTNPCCLLRLIP